MTFQAKTQTFLQIISSPATSFLILVNIAVFVISIALDNRGFENLSLNSFLANWGANFSVFTLSGEYWRLFTSMFLHVNFIHITLNMLALWSLGEILERKLGTGYFITVYMLAGLAGSLLSAITHQQELYLSCGASGAIMGLFGVAVVNAIKHPGEDGLTLGRLALNVVLIFGLGTMANVDNMAHLGGLVAGVVMTVWLLLPNITSKVRRNSSVLASLLVASVIGFNYANAYDDKMRISLEAAKLDYLIGHLGFKDNSSANSYMSHVNGDIENILIKIAEDKNIIELKDIKDIELSKESLFSLKAIKNDAEFIPESAEEYALCKTSTSNLRKTFSKPEEILFFKQLADYCAIHQQAFLSIIDKTKTEFNPKLFIESNLKTYSMMESPTLAGILSNTNELAAAAVYENTCPYTSCKRFK
jgi:rhomboid protease GluP